MDNDHRQRFGRLWRDGEFLKLWGGQGISEIGSQVSALALPTVAILVLGATPFQVGLLAALETLASPCWGWWPASTSTAFAVVRS